MDLIQALNIFYNNFRNLTYLKSDNTSKEKWYEIKKIRENSEKEKQAFEFLEENGHYGYSNPLNFEYWDLVEIRKTNMQVRIVRRVMDIDTLEYGYLTSDGNFYKDWDLKLIEKCASIACT